LTTAGAVPGVADAAVGVPGAPMVSVPPAADAGPDPFTLNGVTLNVYVEPLVRPVTSSIVDALLNVVDGCATPPSSGVTTNPVTGNAGFVRAAVQPTSACPLP